MDIKHVAVFCGSNMGNDPVFKTEIISLADALLKKGWGLVYGGGHRGLMGEISAYMLQNGAHTVGVSPKRFYKEGDEKMSSEFHLVDTMHERKAKMYSFSDAFIIFPGGIGTLDEYAEISTWHQIGFSGKPVAVLNVNGFFDGLKTQIDHMVECGFIKEETKKDYFFSESIDAITSYLSEYEYIKGKWE